MPRYDDFNPREAALHYGSEVEREALKLNEPAMAAAVQAIACGLVYVGDEIGKLREALDPEQRVAEALETQRAREGRA